MEIERFGEVAGTIALAKALYDIGRFDIVKEQFFDSLCCDSWFENVMGVIASIFSGFYNAYDESDEVETMVFSDDIISDYFMRAWEYQKRTGIPCSKNPYVINADREIRRQLSCCYSMGHRLLGYTKTKRTAGKSKLIVYLGICECDCHTKLAFGLIQLYKWFSDRLAEFDEMKEAAA